MLDPTAISLGIGTSLAAALLQQRGKFLAKKVSKRVLAAKLNGIIQDTIAEFETRHPIDRVGFRPPFYSSPSLTDALIRHRILNQFDSSAIINDLKNNRYVTIPEDKKIFAFLDIFAKRYNQVPFLKNIDIEESYKEEIYKIRPLLLEIIKRFDDKNAAHTIDFDLLIADYQRGKSEIFGREKWPYAIDKNEFVKIFEFKSGSFRNDTTVEEHDQCIPFILRQIKDKSVYCVAYYGMGKTTISKFLFSDFPLDTHLYPIFLDLAYEDLNRYKRQTISELVREEIVTVLEAVHRDYYDCIGAEYADFNSALLIEISDRIRKGELFLIFDGIDESLWNLPSLESFARFLGENRLCFFLTSRLEFSPFLDVFEDRFRSDDQHTVITLDPWKKRQWQVYCDGLKGRYPKKSDEVAKFYHMLEDEIFHDLPQRPLFLKMLSDLHINNNATININPALSGNTAAIYIQFIRWKIRDDFARKRGSIRRLNKRNYYSETLLLFRNLAIIGYSRTVIQTGEKAAIADTSRGLNIGEVKDACVGNFNALKPKFVEDEMQNSTLFSTIFRKDESLFQFSHKSFMEYLVANDLAGCIFKSAPGEAFCNDTWDLFQTYEVSNHFQQEVERITVERLDSDYNLRNRYFQNAFENVLESETDFNSYSEKVEEILYYVSKFNLKSPLITAILLRLFNRKEIVHDIYYRTTCISLARMESPSYVEEYVRHLISSWRSDKQAFRTNQKIDIDYYGENNIRRRLEPYVDNYIEYGELEKLNIYRVFSFFTSPKIKTAEEREKLTEKLRKVKEASIEQKENAVTEICRGILQIIDATEVSTP